MLITDKKELQKYSTVHRLWQGIPAIEVTKKGRIFSAFYSGSTKETLGNFVVLLKSDDEGESFSEPITVVFQKEGRCYDQTLWIDPLGRLWLIWAYASLVNKCGVFGAICNDPDAEELVWSDVFFIGKYVMMNKPTVLSTGDWLFPIAVWDPNIKMYALPPEDYTGEKEPTGAFVYKSIDHHTTFEKMGGVNAPQRAFDEHMVIELKNESLMMLIRTNYGIAVSYSYDQGHNWTDAVDSKIGGPSSRFFIRRLKSGRILLVNHYNFTGRNNLTALLSEDDGRTWKYSLLLDERAWVSYPDAVEAEDGYIYIIYDRERGAFKNNLAEVMNDAREILLAKITEEDIIAGKIVDSKSKLKYVVSKLGEYVDDENPFNEVGKFTDIQLATELCKGNFKEENYTAIFDYYPIACENMCDLDIEKLNALFSKLKNGSEDRFLTVLEIVRLIRSVSVYQKNSIPLVDEVKKVLEINIRENLSITQIAQKFRVSEYYLMHAFKKQAGITIGEYKSALRISKAKLLLCNQEKSISEISDICGFESLEYFSRAFKNVESITPSQYRALNCLAQNKK